MRLPHHIANKQEDFFAVFIPQRLFSIYENVEWPFYSPEVTPRQFFLRDCLKNRIYANSKHQSLGQLKDNISREIRNIDNEQFPKVMHNIAVRRQKAIALQGAYVGHTV